MRFAEASALIIAVAAPPGKQPAKFWSSRTCSSSPITINEVTCEKLEYL